MLTVVVVVVVGLPALLPPLLFHLRPPANPRVPRPIVITFRPKKNVPYQSRFRFEVEHGEGFDVVVSGKGTYEEDTTPNNPAQVGPKMYSHVPYL